MAPSVAANDGPDIMAMMVGVEIGTAYLDLKSTLGPRRAARWRSAVAGAADFLIRNGNLAWYTNGNINTGNTELFYLAWRATRDRDSGRPTTSRGHLCSTPHRVGGRVSAFSVLPNGSRSRGRRRGCGVPRRVGRRSRPASIPSIRLSSSTSSAAFTSSPAIRARYDLRISSRMLFSLALVERGFSTQAAVRVIRGRIGMCLS